MSKMRGEQRRTVLQRLGAGVVGVAALSGCVGGSDSGLESELDEVRSATADYTDAATAVDDGYKPTTGDSDAVEDLAESGQPICGMGHHLGDQSRIGSTDPTSPAGLLYGVENGSLVLGAVEYVVPKDKGYETEPPDIFEQDDGAEAEGWTENSPSKGLWTLHVWVHADNDAGTFALLNDAAQFTTDECREVDY